MEILDAEFVDVTDASPGGTGGRSDPPRPRKSPRSKRSGPVPRSSSESVEARTVLSGVDPAYRLDVLASRLIDRGCAHLSVKHNRPELVAALSLVKPQLDMLLEHYLEPVSHQIQRLLEVSKRNPRRRAGNRGNRRRVRR